MTENNRALEVCETLEGEDTRRNVVSPVFKSSSGRDKAYFSYFSEDIRSYLTFKMANGVSQERISKLEGMFKGMISGGIEPSRSCNRKDIEQIVFWVYSQKWTDWTKHDFLQLIKAFFIYHGMEDSIKWIKAKVPRVKLIKPDELVSWQDMEQAINTSKHERHRAFLSLLYDSGCRIGEILNLEYKDIYRDNNGARIYVEGKTGARILRLQRSFEYLLEYLPYAPREGKVFPGSYQAYKKIIRRAFKLAKIEKPCNFHFFRKCRATELGNHLTYAQLCKFFGWQMGSDMPKIYIHTTDDSVDEVMVNLRKCSSHKA